MSDSGNRLKFYRQFYDSNEIDYDLQIIFFMTQFKILTVIVMFTVFIL